MLDGCYYFDVASLNMKKKYHKIISRSVYMVRIIGLSINDGGIRIVTHKGYILS